MCVIQSLSGEEGGRVIEGKGRRIIELLRKKAERKNLEGE